MRCRLSCYSAARGPPRDLDLVERWLHEPHVTRWWLAHSTATTEIEAIRSRVRGKSDTTTHMLVITENQRPIGWAQWYQWDDYPDAATAMGAEPGDLGIEYAIGEPDAIGRRLGTDMIAAMVRHLRRRHPEAGILVGPDAQNRASRIVLERNNFRLLAVRASPAS